MDNSILKKEILIDLENKLNGKRMSDETRGKLMSDMIAESNRWINYEKFYKKYEKIIDEFENKEEEKAEKEDEEFFWAFPQPDYGDEELEDTIRYHQSQYSFRDYYGRTSTTLYANNVTGPDSIRRLVERGKVMQIRNGCSLLMQANFRYAVSKTYTKVGVGGNDTTNFFYEVSNSTYIEQDYFFHDVYVNQQGQKFIFKRAKKCLNQVIGMIPLRKPQMLKKSKNVIVIQIPKLK